MASLDRLRGLIQHDVGGRGLAGAMFDACAGDFAAACADLAAARRVGIVTGFFIPGPDRPETDGPPGAAFLARTLAAWGIPAVTIAEPACHAALRAGGAEACAPDDAPADLTHVVAVERVGPAADGRCYTMRGIDITDRMTDVRPLLAGRRTVGVGDGGNEVGMGKLPPELIARHIRGGDKIACRVATDHLVVAGISNWGAWALGVGTALVLGRVPAIDLEMERRVLRRMIDEGGLIDGVTGRAELSVDGLAWDDYVRPLAAMKEMLR
ncbi:MAG: glutamate cyclase domain-containing protein [Gemmataceae bacterium]